MIKECKKHGLTEFSESVRSRCRKCLVDAVNKRRRKIKVLSVQYKGGKCEVCGYNKCIDALDFHHINPANKLFSIGNKGYTKSWLEIQKELDKCQLICSNCHRELHSIK